jgi:hypothetical protein
MLSHTHVLLPTTMHQLHSQSITVHNPLEGFESTTHDESKLSLSVSLTFPQTSSFLVLRRRSLIFFFLGLASSERKFAAQLHPVMTLQTHLPTISESKKRYKILQTHTHKESIKLG